MSKTQGYEGPLCWTQGGTHGEGEVTPCCSVNATATATPTSRIGGAIGTGRGANTIASTSGGIHFSMAVADSFFPSTATLGDAIDAFAEEEDRHGFVVVFSTSSIDIVHSVVWNMMGAM